VWKRSQYSTFEVTLTLSSEEAQAALVDLCDRAELGIEDWSSVRFICAECSKGNATPHECKPIRHLNTSTYGFGAKNEDRLRKTLREWAESTEDTAFGDIELVLKAD
jgi:hypothetical protein